MSDAVLVALIAAISTGIPATIAAWASLKNKAKQDKQMTPSNGHTLIEMIEDVWGEIALARQHREELAGTDATLRDELHTHDERLQGVEHHLGICDDCMSIDPEAE